MGNRYVDQVFQEIKVKSANNRKIILDGEVNDEECIKACYYLDKIVEMDKVKGTKEPITILIFPFISVFLRKFVYVNFCI